jgi:pimeloyl-ACP methyl ester carboxylesterase
VSPYANEPLVSVTPGKVSFNPGAGRGDKLFVVLRKENGEKLLFVVDTGAPISILDKSLEPELGQRLKTRSVVEDYDVGHETHKLGGYRAPKLFLGDAPLVFSDLIWTDDLTRLRGGRPVMGILGMDCLHHYCLQLDFQARQLRLLDPSAEPDATWGNEVPLVAPFVPLVRGTLLGQTNEYSMLDAGDSRDGAMTRRLFRQALKDRRMSPTNTWKGHVEATFAQTTFAGQTYRDVELGDYLGSSDMVSSIGLRFLARNLVTINFRQGKMYLKRTSEGPLARPPEGLGPPPSMLGWWQASASEQEGDQPIPMDERVLGAPNLRPGSAVEPGLFGFYQLPVVRRLEIPVSAPKATLRAFELPPGNYHVRIDSKVTKTDPDGTRRFEFTFQPTNSRPMAPLPEKGTILLLHDYTRQKEFMVPWGVFLAQAGFRVIALDLRGHGESTGETISYGRYETADLSQALDFLSRQRAAKGKVGVLGVGYGGQLALQWAARDARVGPVVAIAPYARLEDTFAAIAKVIEPPLARETLEQVLDAAAARLELKWADWSAEAAARRLTQPVLLVAGDKDAVVPPESFKLLEQVVPRGSKTLQVNGVSHPSIAFAFGEIGEPIAAWFLEHAGR